MMKDYQEIGKQMPFHEEEGYVEQLVERTTEKALAHTSTKGKTLPLRQWAAAAAIALLLVMTGIWFFSSEDEPTIAVAPQTVSPLDQFLNELSDEDARQLTYYELEEIPEY